MSQINNRDITLYGVGVSYLETIALQNTFHRILDESNAVMYEDPMTSSEYFCYVFYYSLEEWKNGLQMFIKDFAITSTKLYLTRVSLDDIYNDFFLDDDDNENNFLF